MPPSTAKLFPYLQVESIAERLWAEFVSAKVVESTGKNKRLICLRLFKLWQLSSLLKIALKSAFMFSSKWKQGCNERSITGLQESCSCLVSLSLYIYMCVYIYTYMSIRIYIDTYYFVLYTRDLTFQGYIKT